MIKFSAGYIPDRQAHLVGVGLSEGNLKALMDDDSPLSIKSEELGLPGEGFAMFVFAGKDEPQLKTRLEGHLTKVNRSGKDMKVALTVLAFGGGLIFVLPLLNKRARPVYIVGLVEKSFEAMRAGKMPTFRIRNNEPDATNVETLFFAGETEEAMEKMFVDSGMVKSENVRRL